MFGLCKFKDFFGKPNEGVHKFRILNIAIIDVIFSIIFAVIISTYFKIPFLYTIIGIFILGIIIHRLFCVRTTVDQILFSD